ncbi:MAG: protein kinase [Myxococcales bacterium]|nr:protein kinase [Myxococcales bacterium]
MPTTGPSIRRAAPAPPFDIGETVAQRYRVESLLSEDALGYTYTVSEIVSAGEANHALRVLRLLRARMGTLGVKLPDEALSTWRSQLEKARDFRHANIPTIEEMCFGDEHGRVFLVRTAIELEGQPLSALLSARPTGLSEAEAVRLLAGIAEVVEAAHQHGILHLSLSPSRIFVVPSGESIAVRVADFALLPPALAPQFGEAGYLTPEQVEGQPCDRRSDQFALAVILYEMLSSQPAFIGAPDEDRQVTLSRVLHEDPLPLALSRPLEQALARALSRSRAVRFPNLHDFVRALGIDGVAWSLVFPPGSSKSPPLRPVRQALWQPVLLGAAVASLAIFAIWGVASRLGSSTSSPAQATDGSVDVDPGGPGNPGLLSPTVSSGRADAAGEPTLGALPSAQALSDASTAGGVENGSAVLPPSTARADGGGALGQGTVAGKPPLPVSRLDMSAGALRPTGTPLGTGAGGPGNATPVTRPTASGYEIDITTLDGKPITASIKAPILHCIRLIRPVTPFRLILQDIGGRLYVADQSPPNELKQSTDFRDCLKTDFHGKIDAKELSLKGFLRPKTSQ